MNIAKAYTNGFLKAFRLPRMQFIIYFANLITALLLALPFMGVLKSSFDQSAIFSNLLSDFDYTTIANLMFYDGNSVFAILDGIKWLFIAYFLLSIFLTGGIIGTYNKDYYSNSNFFGSGSYNFFRFLGLNLLVIVTQIVFFLLVYIPLSMTLKSIAPKVESELTLYYIAIGAFVFHGLIFMLISNIGDYGKFYLVIDNSFNVFKGFAKGLKYVFSHFIKTFLLYLFLLFIPAVIMYVYLYVERDIKMATGIGILMVFIMQQAFIFLRCFLRSWILASQYLMYTSDNDPSYIQSKLVKTVKEIKPKKSEKKPEKKSKEKENTIVAEEVQNVEQTNYAIDFKTTFSSQNENPAVNKNQAETDNLKIFADDHSKNQEQTIIEDNQKTTPLIIPQDDESIQNQEEEKLEQFINNQTDKDIESKMFESIVGEIELTEVGSLNNNPEKSYLAGQTVEFADEMQIEEQMIKEMDKEKFSEFVDNKQNVNENVISGLNSFSEDIDNEADNTEMPVYDDFEEDPDHFQNQYEKVEQNVVEDEPPVDEENTLSKGKEKKKGDDGIEFEL